MTATAAHTCPTLPCLCLSSQHTGCTLNTEPASTGWPRSGWQLSSWSALLPLVVPPSPDHPGVLSSCHTPHQAGSAQDHEPGSAFSLPWAVAVLQLGELTYAGRGRANSNSAPEHPDGPLWVFIVWTIWSQSRVSTLTPPEKTRAKFAGVAPDKTPLVQPCHRAMRRNRSGGQTRKSTETSRGPGSFCWTPTWAGS